MTRRSASARQRTVLRDHQPDLRCLRCAPGGAADASRALAEFSGVPAGNAGPQAAPHGCNEELTAAIGGRRRRSEECAGISPQSSLRAGTAPRPRGHNRFGGAACAHPPTAEPIPAPPAAGRSRWDRSVMGYSSTATTPQLVERFGRWVAVRLRGNHVRFWRSQLVRRSQRLEVLASLRIARRLERGA